MSRADDAFRAARRSSFYDIEQSSFSAAAIAGAAHGRFHLSVLPIAMAMRPAGPAGGVGRECLLAGRVGLRGADANMSKQDTPGGQQGGNQRMMALLPADALSYSRRAGLPLMASLLKAATSPGLSPCTTIAE